MRKLLGIMIASCLLSCSLVGCGDDTADVKPADKSQATESPEINQEQVEELIDELVEETEEMVEAENESKEAAAEEEANTEKFNLKDNTVYDKDGIKITIASIDKFKCQIAVENNNPDNKQIVFELENLALNGVFEQQYSSQEQLKAGEISNIVIDFKSNNEVSEEKTLFEKMQDVYRFLGEDNMDVLTVGVDFVLQIGNENSVTEYKSVTLLTDKCSNMDDLKKYYGEKVDSVDESKLKELEEGGDKTFDVYIKKSPKDSDVYSVVFVGTGDSDSPSGHLDMNVLRINGKEVSFSRVNDKNGNPTIIGKGWIDVYTYNLDPDTIRADHEIPNDKEINVETYVYSVRDDTQAWPIVKVFIPITTIPAK